MKKTIDTLEFVPFDVRGGETATFELLPDRDVRLRWIEVAVPGPLAFEANERLIVENVQVARWSMIDTPRPIRKLNDPSLFSGRRELRPNERLVVKIRNAAITTFHVALLLRVEPYEVDA